MPVCRANAGLTSKHHLDHGIASVDGIEQGPVTLFRDPQGMIGAPALDLQGKAIHRIFDRAGQALGTGPSLADEVLRTGAQQGLPFLNGSACDHHDWAGRHVGTLAQRGQNVQRVHVGQGMVKQHAIHRPIGLVQHLAPPLFAMPCLAEARAARASTQEHLAHVGAVFGVVFDQQDVPERFVHGAVSLSSGQHDAA